MVRSDRVDCRRPGHADLAAGHHAIGRRCGQPLRSQRPRLHRRDEHQRQRVAAGVGDIQHLRLHERAAQSAAGNNYSGETMNNPSTRLRAKKH